VSVTVEHVHIKSEDPEGTAKFYMDSLDAKLIRHNPKTGAWRIDLGGIKFNITGLIPSQIRKQSLGIEHIALSTDEFDKEVKRLTDHGAKLLLIEASPADEGMRIGFFEAPDGLHQLEIIEIQSFGHAP
jgi:catechol 2,3-dioxygenase-like lactoylglutathione lyase family enzyme